MCSISLMESHLQDVMALTKMIVQKLYRLGGSIVFGIHWILLVFYGHPVGKQIVGAHFARMVKIEIMM